MAAQPLDITIPPEALAGAERAYGDCNCPACKKAVRRVSEALLRAWPGMWVGPFELGEGKMLILPLPTEASDDAV